MPRTCREMVWAYQGHEYAEWDRLSALLCLLANVNRDPQRKRTPYRPSDFFSRPGESAKPRGTPMTRADLKALKGIFTKPVSQ